VVAVRNGRRHRASARAHSFKLHLVAGNVNLGWGTGKSQSMGLERACQLSLMRVVRMSCMLSKFSGAALPVRKRSRDQPSDSTCETRETLETLRDNGHAQTGDTEFIFSKTFGRNYNVAVLKTWASRRDLSRRGSPLAHFGAF
jgi:hypothetical protein